MKVYLYVVRASSNPDCLVDQVPFEVNDKEIFFGPCKKALRQMLAREFLGRKEKIDVQDQELFVVGVNGAFYNHQKQLIRKIVWAGQINIISTFAYAFDKSRNNRRYAGLLKHSSELPSPIHVQPLSAGRNMNRGYKLRYIDGFHHVDSDWVRDLTDVPKGKRSIDLLENELLVSSNKRPFTRDCCFLCSNLWYARGTGIEITDGMISAIVDSLPKKEVGNDRWAILNNIKKYPPFGSCGYQGSKVNGLRGSYLTLEGEAAVSFMAEIEHFLSENKCVQSLNQITIGRKDSCNKTSNAR